MVSIETILYTGIAFNLALVILVVYLVRRARARSLRDAVIRSRQLLEQGKVIHAQKNSIEIKNQLIQEKNELLDEYRKASL